MLFYKQYSHIGSSKTGFLNDWDFSEATTDFKLVKICDEECLNSPPLLHPKTTSLLKAP